MKYAIHKILPLALAIASVATQAEQHSLDHHGHGHHAHVHGLAHMTLARNDKHVWVGLQVPAYDMIGFEREPRDDGERALINATAHQLRQPQTLVKLPAGAQCQLQQADVDSALLETDHSGHDHSHQGHADFVVSQQFECKHPQALGEVTVSLFDHYSRIERVDLEWTLEGKQGSAKVTAADNRIKIK
ncbi:ZrgA family zinc uptake protein [Porticoccus sp. GXU_MW_L64]